MDGGNKKMEKRTPVMAEGLTDHVWHIGELFSFEVPFQ